MGKRYGSVWGAAGFTLVELITVLILVGILAVAALPRFWGSAFDERGFRDALKAALQHARQVAVASRRYVCVTVTGGAGPAAYVALAMDTTVPESVVTVTCDTAVALLAPGRDCAAANQVCAPRGVTLGGDSVIFDPLGRPVASDRTPVSTLLALTVSGESDVTVESETGSIR